MIEMLRPTRRMVFDVLCAHPYGLTAQEMIPLLYFDPDREPDYACGIIRVTIHRMNKRFVRENSPFRVRSAGLQRYAIFIRRVRV